MEFMTNVLHPLDEYKKAFIQFSEAREDEFLIKLNNSGALVLFEQKTYWVCHYDNLVSDFKTYFNDYDLIYTETPLGLWEVIFQHHSEITQEDLIIDIYNAWKTYWNQQIALYHKDIYKKHKAQSWEEFQLLIEKLKSEPGNFIHNAARISDITLIPIIAIALRSQFKNEEDFYRECVSILIEEFPEDFSDDGNFDQMNLDSNSSNIGEAYYIYEIESNFDEDI
jgi:hypothetical protein